MYIRELFKEEDKRKHALLCGLVALVSVIIGLLTVYIGYWSGALFAGTAVSVGYEALQKYKGKGVADERDIIAGMIGTVIVAIIIAIFEVFVF